MGFFSNIGSFFKKSAKSLSNPVGYMKNLGSALSPSNWFSDYDGSLGAFGNVSGDFQDFWDSYTGRDVAMKNYDLQKKQFEYQQQLNKEQQIREDNAMQRKVADLKAAGLNPVLAANGTGAASAPLKAAPAPQIENTSGAMRETLNNAFQGILQVMSMKKDFAQKDAQIALLWAEKAKADAEAAGINIENKYKDDIYSGKVTAQDLDNQLKSGVLQSKIDLEASKLRLSKKEELVKHLEFIVGQKESQLKSIEIEIQKLVKDGKITENQILDKKLELLTTECLQKALDYSNSVWDTDWYHARGLPNGFNAGWMGQLALLISGVGEKGVNQLIDFFSSLFGDNGNGGSGRENSKDFVWKALKKATSYPSSKNSTWNSIQQTYQDYGVRRNH